MCKGDTKPAAPVPAVTPLNSIETPLKPAPEAAKSPQIEAGRVSEDNNNAPAGAEGNPILVNTDHEPNSKPAFTIPADVSI